MDKEVYVKTSFTLWWWMLTKLILLSIVTATISFTVTEAAVFKPLRTWAKSNSKFFGKLIHCGYCFGFWVAALMEFTFKLHLFDTYLFLDQFLTTLVIMWLSGFQWVLMCCLMKFADK